MKWMHAGSVLAIAAAVTVGAASCSNADSATSPSPNPSTGGGGGSTGFGTLRVLMKDSPFSDSRAVLVTFTEVSAHASGAGWQGLPGDEAGAEQRMCDLKRLEDVTDLLGVGQLEAGHYTQLRLEVSRTRLYWDNPSTGPACATTITAPLLTFSEATVPSGTIHLNRQFTIDPGETTTITLDFDGDKSIKQTGNGKYMMQPVIAVVAVAGGSNQ